jgi:hypothetical protein
MNSNLPKPKNLKECDSIDWCIFCHHGSEKINVTNCEMRREFLKGHNPDNIFFMKFDPPV